MDRIVDDPDNVFSGAQIRSISKLFGFSVSFAEHSVWFAS